LNAVWRASKRKPKELEQSPIPEELAYLAGWLAVLPCPLSWAEMSAWSGMTKRAPERWELETLMRLDRIRQ
jgi:hypothetical protein